MILGEVDNREYRTKYTKENKMSKHLEVRKDRMSLILPDARAMFFYEVLKEDGRQVHCVFEDATLYVFNKETGMIITIILLGRKRLGAYFRAANDYASEHPQIQRCAKVHDKNIKKNIELTDEEIKNLVNLKKKHLKMK